MIPILSNSADIVSAYQAQPQGRQAVSDPSPSVAPSTYLSLSVGRDVFSAVEDFFDLGRRGRFNGLQSLGKEDRQQFYRIVGALLMNGYVGYETLLVGKKIERHDIVLQIGDSRLKDAKPYRQPYHDVHR